MDERVICGYLEEANEAYQEGMEFYRKRIFELADKINDYKFLRRIYISLRDFMVEDRAEKDK